MIGDRPLGPPSGTAHDLDEAIRVVEVIGLPIIIRPAYILGGRGTGMAATMEEFRGRALDGLAASPISEILIEKSIAGLEGVRARGDARPSRQRRDHLLDRERRSDGCAHRATRSPSPRRRRLSDVEYQTMRDAAIACIRRVGVETGGLERPVRGEPGDGRAGRRSR
jgi:carbamoyl-phosphate synthase large subunit